MSYQQIAAGVYQACTTYDQFLPPLSADMARSWAKVFAQYNLSPEDLVAGVDKVYAERGDGYRPYPADIAAAARAIRQDRYERSDIHQRGAHEAICDAKAAEKVTAMVTELAGRKAIPAEDQSREFVRRSRGELPTPLAVPCPYCHVGPGRWCVAQSTGQPMRQGSGYHPGRADAAGAASGNKPTSVKSVGVVVADRQCHCGRHILNTTDNTCDRCTPIVDGPQPQTNGDRGTA
jgi:hypothetical protein